MTRHDHGHSHSHSHSHSHAPGQGCDDDCSHGPLGRVLVLGSSNTDLVVEAERLPRPGETLLGGSFRVSPGGKGANQALSAALGGATVRFIGAFGDDAFGAARRAELEQAGIDCSGCAALTGVASGAALIALLKAPRGGSGRKARGARGKKVSGAENCILVAPGANAALSAEQALAALPKDLGPDDVVLASLEVPLPAVSAVFRAAHAAGALTVLNAAPLPPKGLPEALLAATQVLVVNEGEAAALFGGALTLPRTRAKILARIRKGCAQIFVTQGARGVAYFYGRDAWFGGARAAGPGGGLFVDAGGAGALTVFGPETPPSLGFLHLPVPKVPALKVVDTVGAGDCFAGCLAAYLSRFQYEFTAAARFAVLAATLKVGRPGAQNLPPLKEILGAAKSAYGRAND